MFFLMVRKKSEEPYLVTHENDMKSASKVLLVHNHTSLCIVYGCFCPEWQLE